jgi:RimJ/RimL family protein N-acetyltransferase
MHHQVEDRAQTLIFRTRRGHSIAARQVQADDAGLLAGMLGQLSRRTLYLRYMSGRHFSADVIWNEAMRMARGFSADHTTLVATLQSNGSEQAIAIAELVRDQHDQAAGEIALVVRDDQQQQGIGGFLLARLIHVAQHSGITDLSANMLAENKAMLRLIRAQGLAYTARAGGGEIQVHVSIPPHRQPIALDRHFHKLAA